MSNDNVPSTENHDTPINFFRPRSEYMRREVILISIMLFLWGTLTFGFQFLLVFRQTTPAGQSPLTESALLGFPLHYWFSGQFIILCFIGICFSFNSVIDRLGNHYRRKDSRRS